FATATSGAAYWAASVRHGPPWPLPVNAPKSIFSRWVGGNKRHVEVREVMNGIMYILSTGCQWRAIPKDLPPRSTLFDYLDLWSYDGTLDRIHHVLYVACREQGEREASPTAAMVDSQSVKSAEKGGLHRSAWL